MNFSQSILNGIVTHAHCTLIYSPQFANLAHILHVQRQMRECKKNELKRTRARAHVHSIAWKRKKKEKISFFCNIHRCRCRAASRRVDCTGFLSFSIRFDSSFFLESFLVPTMTQTWGLYTCVGRARIRHKTVNHHHRKTLSKLLSDYYSIRFIFISLFLSSIPFLASFCRLES